MQVTRFNHFTANADTNDTLRSSLLGLLPMIAASSGCLSCELFQSRDNPARFVVVEVWDSIQAHQAAVKTISTDALTGIQALLQEMPTGEYFEWGSPLHSRPDSKRGRPIEAGYTHT